MFLKDLAEKTRREVRGRVEKGKSGGGIAKINATHYGCASAKNKGESLENTVLNALHTRLTRDVLVEVFCAEYAKHMNTLHQVQHAVKNRNRSQLAKPEKERENLIQALKDGIPAAVVDDLVRVTGQYADMKAIRIRLLRSSHCSIQQWPSAFIKACVIYANS